MSESEAFDIFSPFHIVIQSLVGVMRGNSIWRMLMPRRTYRQRCRNKARSDSRPHSRLSGITAWGWRKQLKETWERIKTDICFPVLSLIASWSFIVLLVYIMDIPRSILIFVAYRDSSNLNCKWINFAFPPFPVLLVPLRLSLLALSTT